MFAHVFVAVCKRNPLALAAAQTDNDHGDDDDDDYGASLLVDNVGRRVHT